MMGYVADAWGPRAEICLGHLKRTQAWKCGMFSCPNPISNSCRSTPLPSIQLLINKFARGRSGDALHVACRRI
jgi:hypothetical protein